MTVALALGYRILNIMTAAAQITLHKYIHAYM